MTNQSLQSLLSEYSHIGHVFVDCLRRNPDSICQIDAATGQEETNASVLSRSIRLAQALRKFGLRPGDVLALGGNNHLDLHIPYYAALLNGYPIAGVDPLFKHNELKSLFKITQPKIAFCQHTSLEQYKRAAHDLGLDLKIVTFEEGEGSMKEFLETYDVVEPEAEFKTAEFDVDKVYAFLISTSGTTGTPKVAAFKHRTIMEKYLSFMKYLNNARTMRTIGLNLSPVQWISGIINAITMPILSQTKLQTSRPDDIDHLIEMINKYKPHSMLMSPALMSVLLRRWDEVDLSCLKNIHVTGAKTNVDAINKLRARLQKSTMIIEAYGMTETLGPMLTSNVNGPSGSCGKPTYVYDLKEYLRNPEETKKAFTEDGYIKTGDLFYRDENDNYFFVDRIKMLIKYRNAHVVPSEIEEVILQHPGVLDVCVTSIPHPEDGQHPVACVVRKPVSTVTAQEIKELVSSSAWGFYFLFYNAIKTWIQGGNARTPLGPGLHMLAAAEAGILSLIMTNPIWVVKTRLCLQYSDEHVTENKRYKGMVDGLTKIYRTEGIRGLYRGFVPGMFGVSHGALQFMTYEEMKNRYNQYRNLPIDIKLTSIEYLTFAAISKLIAAGATYPYQVVRARLQDQHRNYTGAWHCVTETWRHEGWRGFYKGLKPNLVRVVPATMITFLTYENVSHYMLRRGQELKLST